MIPPSLIDRLGEKVKVPSQKDDRAYQSCGQLCHKKRNCAHEQQPINPAPPPPADPEDPMAAHRTEDAFSTGCREPGHTEAQC